MKNYKQIAQSTNDGLNEIIGMTEGLLDKPEPGVTGIDYGVVTSVGNYNDTLTIEHNLGKVPSKAFLVSDEVNVTEFTQAILNGYALVPRGSTSGGGRLEPRNPYMSETSVVFHSTITWKFYGGTYTWITIA